MGDEVVALRFFGLGILFFAVGCSMISSMFSRKSLKMTKGQPYGSSVELKYADELWDVLEKNKLVGDESFRAVPMQGSDPHGIVVEIIRGKIKVAGFEGDVLVQKNYSGPGISRSRVAKHGKVYLKSISVMKKRRHKYDVDNKNWYWAEFDASGKVVGKINGFAKAGRVAKGAKMGCISCHGGAPGGDYIFSNTAMQLDH